MEKEKYILCGGEGKGGNHLEKENIFLQRRKETEKEEYMWKRKISFCGREEKERKYFEKENIFCGGEEKRRRKRRKI